MAAVSLAWVRQQSMVSSTIIGARTVRQLNDNLASRELDLSADELSELDGLTVPSLGFPFGFLRDLGFPAQQGTTVINGVAGNA